MTGGLTWRSSQAEPTAFASVIPMCHGGASLIDVTFWLTPASAPACPAAEAVSCLSPWPRIGHHRSDARARLDGSSRWPCAVGWFNPPERVRRESVPYGSTTDADPAGRSPAAPHPATQRLLRRPRGRRRGWSRWARRSRWRRGAGTCRRAQPGGRPVC